MKELLKHLKENNNFVICGHVNPDADCIGSQIALKLLLEALGKKAEILLDGELDSALKFLPNSDEFKKTTKITESFISVDVSEDRRLNVQGVKEKCNFLFTIDHHQNETPNADFYWVDPDAASCSLLVWELAKEADVITEDIATACLCGLYGDTGSFRYQNADTRAFNAAAEMVSAGANPAEIAKNLFQTRSIQSFKLERAVLDHMIIDKKHRFVLSYIDAQNFADFNATKTDAEGMIDLIRSLACVDVACILRQIKPGEPVHGSIRSKTDKDVSILAMKHTGGGHKAAAGFTMDTTDLCEAFEIVKRQLVEFMS